MNKKIIHTGLYTEHARNFFDQAFRAISDYSSKLARKIKYADVICNPDGEVVFEIDLDPYGYRKSTIWDKYGDDKAKEWLAIHFKQFIRNYFRSDAAWSRLNDDEFHYIERFKLTNLKDGSVENFTVAEAYLVYDMLLSRRNAMKKYSKDLIGRVVGRQKDPLKTEMERIRREKLKALEDKYQAEQSRIYNEQQEKIRRAREQIQVEADAERAKVKAAYEAEKEEIERKANSVNKVGSLFSGFAA